MWKPDLSFDNDLSIRKHAFFGGKSDTSGWITYPHKIGYSELLKIKKACTRFDFTRFPFDEQTCGFYIQETKYDSTKVKLLPPGVYYRTQYTELNASPIMMDELG